YFNIYYNYFDSIWHVSENVIAVDSACREFSYHVSSDSSIILTFTMRNNDFDNLYFIKKNNGIWSAAPSPLITGNFDIYYPYIISNDTYTYIVYTAFINGLSQVFLSKYNGTSWSSPKIISNNSSNATFPTGILNNNELYLFYVSDVFPNGIIINKIYDADMDTLILEETVVNERGGFIYTPQVTIDASGDLQLFFTCGDVEFAGSRGPNNLYQITKANVTLNIINKEKPYSLKYGHNDIMFSSNSNFPMSINIFDKMGRFLKSYNNVTSLRMNSSVFAINDVYFLLISDGKQQYSEKVLWLK
ncbi:hypothetical protein KAU15_05445, partial [candidate division WOR-3 bacterium]|nr:hypothetical protein [candidate division WOR-3 bacterium]